MNVLLPPTSGVYCLWNKITNQIYVGSAQDLSKRIPKHFNSKCHNVYLKRSIKKYGENNFSITWIETGDDFQKIEQMLIDFVFTLESTLRFNIARKAGGNPGGSIEGQRALCLKGKSREELRLEAEAGGSPKQVPLFLIDTETSFITRIESSCEGERLGFGLQQQFSNYSKPNCLNRVKTCLVAKSESEAMKKFEAWLQTPGNTTIDNPIVLALGKSDSQSALYKLANVNQGNFSQMYREAINPSTGEPLRFSMQSKADFNWYGTEVKAGDWFRCVKSKHKTAP